MRRVLDDSFKKMAVVLSYHKGSVEGATHELEIDPSRLSKWRFDRGYNGGTTLPKNHKITL
ncbi:MULTISPECIES: hypothetical protein [Sphingobacterium]|uniref:hypothetical protein n=1 Tax=Sphingobacterium TaxID=28453 RepID=UPI00104B0B0D|nr:MULTISPECIES: hypothetical protein [Sphingobacterium]MCW2263096.1 transposase-like protein [Sphingobacterium kitahiroshimense]TCR11920.1 hypothetical protein EDF67_103333 [Sphingobacterium sp. JUb78]